MNLFALVFEQLARMGLAFKSDPPRAILTEGREWGPAVDGLQLSIAPRPGKPLTVSVILRNGEEVETRIQAPDWLHYFTAHVTAASGDSVPLSAYGREALDAARAQPSAEVVIGPHAALEIELPVGILYGLTEHRLTEPGALRLTVSCELGGGLLTSNQLDLEK